MKPVFSQWDEVPFSESSMSVPIQFKTLFRDLIILLHKVQKPSMTWRMLLRSLELTVGMGLPWAKEKNAQLKAGQEISKGDYRVNTLNMLFGGWGTQGKYCRL